MDKRQILIALLSLVITMFGGLYYYNYMYYSFPYIENAVTTITHSGKPVNSVGPIGPIITFDQSLISTDVPNIQELFGDVEYTTNIYKTNLGTKIAITTNSKPVSNNKNFVLWLNGNNDTFYHPFVAKELIAKGYDIIAVDFPNFGFAQTDAEEYNYYNTWPQIRSYIDAILFKEVWRKQPMIRDFDPTIVGYGHSTGGLLILNYQLDRPKTFSKIVLNSPLMDWYSSNENIPSKVLPFLALFAPKQDLTGFLGTFNNTSLSQLVNDIRPFGYTKEYIKSVLDILEKTPTLDETTTYQLNDNTYRKARYLICEHYFNRYFLVAQDLMSRVRKAKIDTPSLVLQSDRQSLAVSFDEESENYGMDPGDNALDIKEIDLFTNQVLTNRQHYFIPDGTHDVFYSKKPSRELAISYFVNFI